jgi:hypothetical protein
MAKTIKKMEIINDSLPDVHLCYYIIKNLQKKIVKRIGRKVGNKLK